MSDFHEMAALLRAREKHDYTIAELAELREAHERLAAVARETNAALAESIRIQQRVVAAITRALGEKQGLRSVPREPEMAVWNAAEAEKR